ncbi:hypothetical protein M409DRAFT_48722 [Zasmidium cellare ATCC 36951]|uniref:Uncharacterized protein n=1 Tax=Zasmidium cellare ATCC 36951 TaxID=1080233 RepID=A0A6A6D5V2_ZASCE|nr:uncharacterized protein M409DRAFT_48722 [Zasmidium cellare ATCC 36951]KAF2173798.1 hypothetical protein M409DRAFT_48722 [Zasmidium cellare ATCC 36951]
MAAHQHSRSSGSSVSSNGSSYQLILDHILTYPGDYEIPLRTMYSLNCQPRGQNRYTPPSSNNSSPSIAQGSFSSDDKSTETLTQNLMAQLSKLPNQVAALPPSFITSFVQRCFPSELTHVDFPQALTGLDYLKDLETKRRREVASAFDRLDIDRDALAQDAKLAERYPGVLQWVESMEMKERKVDTLYTQVYIGLRRWILINELSLQPFNKHNCVAMLNTLYPPMGMKTQPTTKLTEPVLKSQRDGFFKYIQAVEKSGTRILNNLMQQGKRDQDENGWAAVTRTLSMYLQLANSVINECGAVCHPQDVSPQRKRDSNQSRHQRKADSGISFTSNAEQRPSTRSSASNEPSSPIDFTRPKTPLGGRPSTALEKIARGLKGIGRSRTDVTEIIGNDTPPVPQVDKPKMLRKMRSLGSLTDRKGSFSSVPGRQPSDTPAFDVEEMRRKRQEYEAGVAARPKTGKRASNEV